MNKTLYQLPKEKIGSEEIFDLVFKDSSIKHGLQEFSTNTLKKINAFEKGKVKANFVKGESLILRDIYKK